MTPMPPSSAIPTFYWLVFGWYEPLLTSLSFVGTLIDPKKVHDQQAPRYSDSAPTGPLSRATLVTLLQLAHVVGLLGLINFFILSTARKYLFAYPALQERMVTALLTPLLVGDVLHLAITFWALGDGIWDLSDWTPLLWTTVLTGLALMSCRIAWHLGIGRYMDKRDGEKAKRQ